MNRQKLIERILRVAVAGEFIGHGVFALQGKKEWVDWISQMTTVNSHLSTQILFFIGLFDILLALIILLRVVRGLVLWMAFWGFWTALLGPLVGESVWDFIQDWANWGAPLALYLLTAKGK